MTEIEKRQAMLTVENEHKCTMNILNAIGTNGRRKKNINRRREAPGKEESV